MRQWTTVKAYSRKALHSFRTACNALLCRSQKVTCTVNSCVPIGPQSDTVAGIVAVEPASVIRELVYEDVLPTALHAIVLRTQETESEYAADDEGQETLDEASDVQEEPGNIAHDKQLSLDDPVIGIDVATSNEPMNGCSAASANFLSPVLKDNHLDRFHSFLSANEIKSTLQVDCTSPVYIPQRCPLPCSVMEGVEQLDENAPRWEDPVPPFHPVYKPTAFNYIYHPGLKLIAFHRQMGTPAPRQLQRLAAYYAFHCAN